MTDKMKSTIVGGIIGGLCLVLSTTLPVYLSFRNNIKEMQIELAIRDATIAVLQERTIAEGLKQKNFFEAVDHGRGLRLERPTVGYFLMQGRSYCGLVATEMDVHSNGFVEFQFLSTNTGFVELEFYVGVLDRGPTVGFSTGKLIITFDGTNEGEEYGLRSDMDATMHRLALPEGITRIRFEIISYGEKEKRPTYGIGNICVR